MEEKILSEVIIKLARKNKKKLIDKLIDSLKNEGRLYTLEKVIELLKLKNIQIKGQEPAKLYLAFDYDEKKIEKMVKDKFKIDAKIIEKNIDPDLILGGKMITSNYIIDFSFKNLLNKLFTSRRWKI
jgi:F0F1-type ATP synthase delta subunit